MAVARIDGWRQGARQRSAGREAPPRPRAHRTARRTTLMTAPSGWSCGQRRKRISLTNPRRNACAFAIWAASRLPPGTDGERQTSAPVDARRCSVRRGRIRQVDGQPINLCRHQLALNGPAEKSSRQLDCKPLRTARPLILIGDETTEKGRRICSGGPRHVRCAAVSASRCATRSGRQGTTARSARAGTAPLASRSGAAWRAWARRSRRGRRRPPWPRT